MNKMYTEINSNVKKNSFVKNKRCKKCTPFYFVSSNSSHLHF